MAIVTALVSDSIVTPPPDDFIVTKLAACLSLGFKTKADAAFESFQWLVGSDTAGLFPR